VIPWPPEMPGIEATAAKYAVKSIENRMTRPWRPCGAPLAML